MCITLPKAPVLKNYSLILFCDYLTFWESGAIDTPFKIALSFLLENLFAQLQVLLVWLILLFTLYYLLVYLIMMMMLISLRLHIRNATLTNLMERGIITSFHNVIIGKAIFLKYSIFYYSLLSSESWSVDWANK